jgi:hypothetical protein
LVWIVEGGQGGRRQLPEGSSVRGWLNRIFLLVALAGIARCGTTPPPPAVPAPAIATSDVGGLWTGTTRVTPCELAGERCNAVNNVTFTLTQYGSQLTGSYACAAGNADCRLGGAGNAGKIMSGSVSGNRINVAVKLPVDKSDCYYNGAATSSAQANGIYVCYRDGRMIEEGVWSLARQSPE